MYETPSSENIKSFESFVEEKATELKITTEEYRYRYALLEDGDRTKLQDLPPEERNSVTKQLFEDPSPIEASLRNTIHERIKKDLEIDRLGFDVLTEVRNRRSFDTELSRRRSKISQDTRKREGDQQENAFHFLFIDIDHFKKVNDTHGHAAGDAVLRHIAQTLQECLRDDEDFIARYGGEEFCVLLSETNTQKSLAVAERIRKTIEESPFKYRGKDIPITISLGVSHYDEDSDLPLHEADKALYIAKGQESKELNDYTIVDNNRQSTRNQVWYCDREKHEFRQYTSKQPNPYAHQD